MHLYDTGGTTCQVPHTVGVTGHRLFHSLHRIVLDAQNVAQGDYLRRQQRLGEAYRLPGFVSPRRRNHPPVGNQHKWDS